MHFWIDKRAGQLHSYGGGRGRPPGSGGFYSRTFGNRHHHPPPLLRSHGSHTPSNSSTSTNPNHIQTHNPNHNNTSTSTSSNIPLQLSMSNRQGSGPMQLPLSQTHNYNQAGENSAQNTTHFDITAPSQSHSHPFRFHGASATGYMQQSGGNGFIHGNNHHPNLEAFNYLGTGEPGLSGGGFNGGVPGRRPRSQSHSVVPPSILNSRRRSSSSSGSFNQRRASMNRWTYDPYHINQHQHSRPHHSQQMWSQGTQEFGGQTDPSAPSGNPNLPRVSVDLSSDSHTHSLQVTSGIGTSPSTSTHSLSDPAWRRTKRIGLTLCFMAFILLSTVAAKFVIEGPWLIDKQPRTERTEATIYFFLTELIFVVFAMALFFTGVTCLRKRTNAYLLRQFNQYIMQTSPNGATTVGSPPEYFNPNNTNHNHPNNHNASNPGLIGMGLVNMNSAQGQGDRPFHHHFIPSLENHLMNMHISVAESSNFAMSGLSKPPPYHIALYLPVPDEQCEISQSQNQLPVKDTDKRNSQQNQQPSSWISSCLADGGDRGDDNDNDKTEDESEDETVDGRPRRKRQKSDPNSDRSETPPPPYGQL